MAAIKQRDPEVFINARVDTYWLGQQANPASTIERALRYVDAGADGIFVPLANDRDELAEIIRHVPRPLNTLPVPGMTLAELAELGSGPGINRLGRLQRRAVRGRSGGAGRPRRTAAAAVGAVRRAAGTPGRLREAFERNVID